MVIQRLTGQYLNAEGVRQYGVFWRIVSQPTLEHSDDYDTDRYAQDVVNHSDGKTQKRYSMNATSSNKCLDVLGNNEGDWLNTLLEVELKNEKVFGKMQDTVYVKNIWKNGAHPTNVDFTKNPYAVVQPAPQSTTPIVGTPATTPAPAPTVNVTAQQTATEKQSAEHIKRNVEQIKTVLLTLVKANPSVTGLIAVLDTGDLKAFYTSFLNIAKNDAVLTSFDGLMKSLLPAEAWATK
jgi:hypothetical protein